MPEQVADRAHAGSVAFGKVPSPQYLVWVAATAPLTLGRLRPFVLAATVGAASLTCFVYIDGYDDLLQAGRASWVMLARNAILVALFCGLVVELAARGRASQARPAAPSPLTDSECAPATTSRSSSRPAS